VIYGGDKSLALPILTKLTDHHMGRSAHEPLPVLIMLRSKLAFGQAFERHDTDCIFARQKKRAPARPFFLFVLMSPIFLQPRRQPQARQLTAQVPSAPHHPDVVPFSKYADIRQGVP
jgi:hypothetical protein